MNTKQSLPVLFDVPALTVDHGVLSPQSRLDRRVVWNVLHALAVAGWLPVSVTCSGEETSVRGCAIATMEEVFDLDEARVQFARITGEVALCYFVLGNEGPYALSDYTLDLSDVIDRLDFDRLA